MNAYPDFYLMTTIALLYFTKYLCWKTVLIESKSLEIIYTKDVSKFEILNTPKVHRFV